MKDFWNDYKMIILVILSLLIFSFVLMLREEELVNNIGISLFVNVSTTALTVLVIDRLYRRIEVRKKKPLEFAAYNDATLWCNKFISFWQTAYRDCGYYAPKTDKGIFLEDEFRRIYDSLQLDAIAPVTPKISWERYLLSENQRMIDGGREILVKYAYYIPPEIYKVIYQLIDSPFIYTICNIPAIKLSDIEFKTNRKNVLGAYTAKPKQAELDLFLKVHGWCFTKHKELGKLFKGVRTVSALI